jgi:hypothetical protein
MNAHDDCTAYAEYLQHEHRELHERLRQMQARLNNVGSEHIDAPLKAHMLQCGDQLRLDLVRHFSQEENGGSVDYACSRLPALAPAARALEREHRELLAQLESLLKLLQGAAPGELAVADLKQQFDDFVVRLLAHENRENRLVERGLNLMLD